MTFVLRDSGRCHSTSELTLIFACLFHSSAVLLDMCLTLKLVVLPCIVCVFVVFSCVYTLSLNVGEQAIDFLTIYISECQQMRSGERTSAC